MGINRLYYPRYKISKDIKCRRVTLAQLCFCQTEILRIAIEYSESLESLCIVQESLESLSGSLCIILESLESLGSLESLRIPTESLRIPRQESLRIPDKNP